MKNNMISYISIFIVGIIIGILGFFLIVNTNGSEISSLDKEQTLYSCGMHPNIIEDEPGTCPICGMNLTPIRNGKDAADKKGKDKEVLYWRAPMDPNEIYDAPGKSKMGMELIPVYNYEAGEQGVVSVDGSTIQNMNIKIEQVKERSIASTIITNGILKVDERKEFSIHSKFNGRIEKLYINYN